MRYTVKCERDESRWWIAQVREAPGCRTQARTLAEVQERIREALSLFVDDARRPTSPSMYSCRSGPSAPCSR